MCSSTQRRLRFNYAASRQRQLEPGPTPSLPGKWSRAAALKGAAAFIGRRCCLFRVLERFAAQEKGPHHARGVAVLGGHNQVGNALYAFGAMHTRARNAVQCAIRERK